MKKDEVCYEFEFEWSGTLMEYSITVESLMKANNWSREKAKEHMDQMVKDLEEIKNDE